MTWDPGLYEQFRDQRLRPGLDLAGRIPLTNPRQVVDLGCGSGRLTRMLAERWPGAEVLAIDTSPEMLAAAEHHPRIRWVADDIGTWQTHERFDLVWSNAALHWVGDHNHLFPRLLGQLRPGGVLAVQMPDNFGEPTHEAIREVATSDEFCDRIGHLAPGFPVAPAADYRAMLSEARWIDQWETTYHHDLTGDDPVLRWTMGSIMRPILEVLPEPDRTAFLGRVAERYRVAYPPQADGVTVLPFRRRFIVAGRG